MSQSATAGPAALAEHGTSAVSDALDLLGSPGAVFGPRRLSGAGPLAGPAFTVAFEPAAPGEPAPAADFLDDVPAGAMVVIANSGRHCTVWGDILAQVAARRGVAGTVIDGYCRDLDGIRAVGYSVWALDAFVRTGKNRVRMVAAQVPVVLGAGEDAVTVRPGDLVCADGSGVVVVPAALVEEVTGQVDRVARMEAQVLRDVAAGLPLREARAARGYHAVGRRLS